METEEEQKRGENSLLKVPRWLVANSWELFFKLPMGKLVRCFMVKENSQNQHPRLLVAARAPLTIPSVGGDVVEGNVLKLDNEFCFLPCFLPSFLPYPAIQMASGKSVLGSKCTREKALSLYPHESLLKVNSSAVGRQEIAWPLWSLKFNSSASSSIQNFLGGMRIVIENQEYTHTCRMRYIGRLRMLLACKTHNDLLSNVFR